MESSRGSSSRRQGILTKPSYNNRNLIDDDPSMSSLSSLPDMDSSNLNTIDEENPEEEQEVKSFLHRRDSHHDSDGDNDDDDDSNPSVDELKYRMQSKPENDESHTNFFFGNRLFKKHSPTSTTTTTSKPTMAASPQRRVRTAAKGNKYRESMISVDTLPGGTRKPLKNWHQKLVIKQSCRSLMAEDLMTKDMYYNTLSVGITAVTFSAIFTSLEPSTRRWCYRYRHRR